VRRILIFALTFLAVAAFAAPAIAADHTIRITEIQTGMFQFVELRDSVDEPLPNQPYRLVFYDARGNKTGSENLLRNGLDNSGTDPYTVGTNIGDADENLSAGTAIDPDSGQVCFTRGSDEQRIHCVSYGCVTNPVRSDLGGNDPAPVPYGVGPPAPKGNPEGSPKSSQRQASGRYHLADPTPDATNRSGLRGFTCEIGGTDGTDRIVGTPFDDLILAGAGNDRIRSLAGNDRILAGRGRDRVSGGQDNDRISGESGNDRIDGNSGKDRLRGGSGRDRMRGGSGNDRVFGGSGNDSLFGNSGRDILQGNGGNDLLYGGTGRDRLFGGSGRDGLSGGPGRDRLNGGPGRDLVVQ
jgi:Ca2+-binding RTX toxin-like protein